MKKCPYCAEEIPKESIKCKHCGELLSIPTENTGTAISDSSGERHDEKDKADSVEDNPQPTKPRPTDNSQCNEISSVNNLAKKPSKYGWGWVLLLAMLFGLGKNVVFSDNSLEAAWSILPLLFLIPYFALRRRFLWKPGLQAGVCTYILAIIVLFVMLALDTIFLNMTIASVTEKHKDKVEFFKQEQGKYDAKIIYEPQTKTAIKQNIKTIDEILQHENTKQKFYDSMWDDFKIALKGKMNKKSKKPYDEVIDKIKLQRYNAYLKQKKAFELLRNYYLTGKEKLYQEYSIIYQEAQEMINEHQKLLKDAF